MAKTTISLLFNRKGRLNKNNKGAVEMYCYLDGKTKYFNTGIYIYKTEWDKKRREVNKSHPNATKMNILLSRMKSQIEEYELSILNERGNFTFSDLKEYVPGGKNSRNNFIDWLKKEIEDDITVKPNTRGYRLNMVNKLIEAVGDNIPNSRVDYSMLKTFDRHMASNGLTESTRSKLHNQLRKFINISYNEGIIKNNPYKSFKVKRPTYDMKKCLWFADLDRIWNLEYPKESGIELARLKFLFSCYAGLRISDNTNLSWTEIRDGKLFVKMQKTVRPVVVPINILGDRAEIILKRAKELYNLHDKVFKNMPDQTANKYLKRIGIDAEIPFPLTFHVARHTFCTMIAHETGSVFKVMEYAGIYKVDTAMVYVNLNRLYSS